MPRDVLVNVQTVPGVASRATGVADSREGKLGLAASRAEQRKERSTTSDPWCVAINSF